MQKYCLLLKAATSGRSQKKYNKTPVFVSNLKTFGGLIKNILLFLFIPVRYLIPTKRSATEKSASQSF